MESIFNYEIGRLVVFDIIQLVFKSLSPEIFFLHPRLGLRRLIMTIWLDVQWLCWATNQDAVDGDTFHGRYTRLIDTFAQTVLGIIKID